MKISKWIGSNVKLSLGVLTLWMGLEMVARADEEVFNRSLPSLACVLSPGENDKTSMGSGVLVEDRLGLLVTAYHVVEKRPGAVVFFPVKDARGEVISDPRYYAERIKEIGVIGRVIAADPKHDLALIRLDSVPAGCKAAAIARRSPRPGQEVFAIGNSGVEDGVLWRYRDGKVRQVYRKEFTYASKQRVDARVVEMILPSNGGDSGGPIVNSANELVAITAGHDTKQVAVDYGIDVEEIRGLLSSNMPAGSLVGAEPEPGPLTAPAPAPGFGGSSMPAPMPAHVARVRELRSTPGVDREGRAGMEVRFKLDVDNSKGMPVDVYLRVVDANQRPLVGKVAEFTTPGGGLGTSIRVTPKFDETVFPDLMIFIPFSAINASAAPGEETLAFEVDVREVGCGCWITPTPPSIKIYRDGNRPGSAR